MMITSPSSHRLESCQQQSQHLLSVPSFSRLKYLQCNNNNYDDDSRTSTTISSSTFRLINNNNNSCISNTTSIISTTPSSTKSQHTTSSITPLIVRPSPPAPLVGYDPISSKWICQFVCSFVSAIVISSLFIVFLLIIKQQ